MPRPPSHLTGSETTRRRFLGALAKVGGMITLIGASLGAAPANAAKLPPAEIGYQARPKGRQRCDLCANWQPPEGCKVVAGSISPAGWCGLFVAKR